MTSERAVIATMITFPATADAVLSVLPPADFHDPRWKRVYETLGRLHGAGRGWDVALLANEGIPPQVVEEALDAGAPIPDLVGQHVRAVRLSALRRRAVLVARQMVEQAKNPESDIEALIAETVAGLQACHVDDEAFRHISQPLEVWLSAVKERFETPTAARRSKGVPTGIAALNERLTFGGLPRGHMTVVAAQSGGGKTAFANSALAVPTALAGGRVGVCSLEDDAVSVAVRDVSALANLPNRQLQRDEVSDMVEWQEVCQQAQRLADTSLWVYDTPPASVDALCAKCRRQALEHGLDLLIVDFLQYVPSGRTKGNKTEREEYTLRQLALMSRKLRDTATVVLSQYRDIPATQRPTDNDIRGAKVARHFAHTILHVWETQSQVEAKRKTVIVSKQKQGPVGEVEVGWERTRVKFFDVEEP